MFPTTPEPQQDGFASFMESAVPVFIGIVFVLVVVGFISSGVIGVKNYLAAKEKGEDLFTLETDLQVKALQSQALAAGKNLEERLAEIDDLADRGVIDADERAAARAKILADG